MGGIILFFLMISFQSPLILDTFEYHECHLDIPEIHYTEYLAADPLLKAIAFVESRFDTSARGLTQDGGLLQITPIFVKDINKILEKRGDTLRYTLEDRFSPMKSIEMFYLYHEHYKHTNPESIARSWNAGPKWYTKDSLTDNYWNKVQKALVLLEKKSDS
jgi:hypothetical protein